MGAKNSKYLYTEDIICPNCPLTPIISLFMNKENKLTCEYRCPNLHFGYIPFTDIFKSNKIHGKICSKCKKENTEINKELLYCGTCKEYFCTNCRPEHDQEKESHKIMIEKSRVNYTCLEHDKNFIGYCFNCLADLCPDCKRHESHTTKSFEEIFSSSNYSATGKFYLDSYKSYIGNFKRQIHFNKILFEEFKKRNQDMLDFIQYLNDNLQYKKKLNKLNSEIIINFLNIPIFDYNVEQKVYSNAKDFENYCRSHLILKYRPISFICNFSNNKQDFELKRLDLVEYHYLDSEDPKYFNYSPIAKTIIFISGQCLYFLTTKQSDKKIEKIRFDANIYSIRILNKNILAVCLEDEKNIYLYKLIANSPYYKEDKTLPTIETNVYGKVEQIIGNFDNYLVTMSGHREINLHQKKKEIYEVVASNVTLNLNSKNLKPELKAIWKNYLVVENDVKISIIDLDEPKLDVINYRIKFSNDTNKTSFLVFKGNIITFEKDKMIFLNIPKLNIVSKIQLSEFIYSISIINPRTMIVIEKDYIEQLEVNTWKSLSIKTNFGENNGLYLLALGAGKELFFYNKSDHRFYSTQLSKEKS